VKPPHNSKDLLLKHLAQSLSGRALEWMGIDDVHIVSALPTEQPVLDMHGQFMDSAFLTDTGVLLHLEYQSSREPDLYRFLKYDAVLSETYKKPVRTVVLYTDGLEAPDRLDAGYLRYRVDNVFLRARDGQATLERIELQMRAGKWTIEDRLDLAFLPYMRHPEWSHRDVVEKTAAIAQAIPDDDERNLAAALILLMSAKNLSEEAVLRLKEALMMTDVVKVIARDEYEKGKIEGKIEVARSMLARGLDERTIAEVTGLTKEQIEKLRQAH